MNPVSDVTVVTAADPYETVGRWSADHPGRLGFDVETDGAWSAGDHGAALKGELRCVAFSDGANSIVLAPDVHPGPLLDHPLVAHQASFDLAWLARVHGVDRRELAGRVDDTIVMARQIDPWRAFDGGFGLKTLGAELLGNQWRRTWDEIVERYGVAEPEDEPKSGNRSKVAWATIAFADAGPYCADDAAQTALLHRHYLDGSTPEDRAVFAFERRLDAVVATIEDRGFCCDVGRAEAFRRKLAAGRANAVTILSDEYGMARPTDAEFRKLLQRLGAPLTVVTPTGQWKVDKRVRSALIAGHGPWARPAELYKAVKDFNAWCTRLAKGRDIARPAIATRGTVTWRWTVVAPPLHTFPKEPKILVDGAPVDLRSIWMAPPCETLIAADYSAMEFVVCAGLSGDRGMLAAAGRHYEVLQEVLGVSAQQAKIFALAGQYNRGFRAIAGDLGIPPKQAQAIRARVFGAYVCPTDCLDPDPLSDVCRAHGRWQDGLFNLRPFRRSLTWDAVGRYHVWRTPTGRKLAFDEHHAVNYAVQGHSHDLTMRALLDARAAGLDVWLAVHDELIISAAEHRVADAVVELERCMATTVGEATLHAGARVLGHRWQASTTNKDHEERPG